MGTRLRRRLVALDPSLTISTAILRSQIGLHGSTVFPGDGRVQSCIVPAQFSFRQFAGKRPALPYRIVSLARHRPVLTPRPAMHGSLSFSSPTIDICGQLDLLPAPIEPKLDDAESFPRCDLYKSPLAGRLVAAFLLQPFCPILYSYNITMDPEKSEISHCETMPPKSGDQPEPPCATSIRYDRHGLPLVPQPSSHKDDPLVLT